MNQLQLWILSGKVSRIVMAIISKETRLTLERWQFDLNLDHSQHSQQQE
jgi:mitotic spindle assembly checkpoint protein MAD2